MTIHLQVLLGRERGRTIALGQSRSHPYVVGRGADCDVVLQSDLVSRAHARIVAGATDISVVDLESSNGTFVNGARAVGVLTVAVGEIVAVGDTPMRVHGDAVPPLGSWLLPGATPGAVVGSLAEVPPATVLRYIAVLKKTGVLVLTSPTVIGRITFSRGHVVEVRVDGRKTRDLIQALTAIFRWRGTFELEPLIGELPAGALLGLDAVIPPVGAAARPSMMPKPPRPR